MSLKDQELPGGGIEARPPLGEPLARDWRWAAQLLGERLAANGPAGYYTFTPTEWLEWATGQIAGEVAPRASRRDECQPGSHRPNCECYSRPDAAVPRREALAEPLTKYRNISWTHSENGDQVGSTTEWYCSADVDAALASLRQAEQELKQIKTQAKCLRLEHLIGGDDIDKRSATIKALHTFEAVAALQIELQKAEALLLQRTQELQETKDELARVTAGATIPRTGSTAQTTDGDK